MTDTSEARPSATVVLARRTDCRPEVYMVRRRADLPFGDAYAFPGGVVEAVDLAASERCTGIPAARADELLGVSGALAYYSAAARELFEESGVLLTDSPVDARDADDARQRLNGGSLQWDRYLYDADLRIRCDALHYFGFWITPLGRRHRYSTRFFLAVMPAGQSAAHCGLELTHSCWTAADDAVAATRRGEKAMHFPTIRTLEDIARHDSIADLVAWADARAESGVPCILPEIRSDGAESRIFVDGADTGTTV